MSNQQKEHVDLNVLQTLRDVMDGDYPMLLEVFIKDSEQRVRELNLLAASPSQATPSVTRLHELARMAHSFKGSSSNMGAARLADLCRELEELADAKAIVSESHVKRLVQAIHAEFLIARDLFDVERQTSLTRH